MIFATSKSEKCRKTEVFGALPIFNLRNISHIYTLLSHFFEFVLAATQKRHYLALERPFLPLFKASLCPNSAFFPSLQLEIPLLVNVAFFRQCARKARAGWTQSTYHSKDLFSFCKNGKDKQTILY